MLMNARVSKRLERLDRAFIGRGCECCHDWSEIVLCDDQGQSARHERCPHCGRVVPIRASICIVGIPLETL
jgi:hypothetical protein